MFRFPQCMQNPACPRSFVWGSSGSHQITASGAHTSKYLELQVQVPDTLLFQVRDRLTDILIPAWVGITLKGRYSGSAQFPALGQKRLWRRVRVDHAGLQHRSRRQLLQRCCILDLPSRERAKGKERESFRFSHSTDVQSVHCKSSFPKQPSELPAALERRHWQLQ